MTNSSNYGNNQSNHRSSDHRSSGKNGYEIRTDVLILAQKQVEFEYHEKFKAWQESAALNDQRPTIPTMQDVINAATRLYEFVNTGNTRKV